MPFCRYLFKMMLNRTQSLPMADNDTHASRAHPHSTGHGANSNTELLHSWSDENDYPHLGMNETALNISERVLNFTVSDEDMEYKVSELKLIKAVVLVVVIGILMLSTCKILLKNFSRYSGKPRDM